MKFLYTINQYKKNLLALALGGLMFNAQAQTGNLQGFIKTSDGKPAAEVNVQLKEIKKGTISKTDGSFQISNIPEGKYHIILSFVGLQTIQKPVSITSNQTSSYNFKLLENETELT